MNHMTIHQNVVRKAELCLQGLIVIHVFLLFFPHTTTLREISFYGAVACWIVLRAKKGFPAVLVSAPFLAISCFVAWALLSSLLGPMPAESFGRWRSELLQPLLLFCMTATEMSSQRSAKLIVGSMALAFFIFTALTLLEASHVGSRYFLDKEGRYQYYWLDTGYIQRAYIILPAILGLITVGAGQWVRASLAVYASAVCAIILVYRSFSALVAAIGALMLWSFAVQYRRRRAALCMFLGVVVSALAVVAMLFASHPAVEEYRAKAKKVLHAPGEFAHAEGFSNRMPVWKIAVDLTMERPVFGYGWGMKKFGAMLSEDAYIDGWANKDKTVHDFLQKFRGGFFPPHNMYLEVAFQSGYMGLVLLCTFFGTLLFGFFKRMQDADRRWLTGTALITAVSFLVFGLMNNELGSISGKIVFVISGLALAADPSSRQEENT
jgi:O-antigen ligase